MLFGNGGETSAYEKAAGLVGEFIKVLFHTIRVRRAGLDFVTGSTMNPHNRVFVVRMIQRRWRGMLGLDKTRRQIMRMKWDKMVELLARQNQAKGKRMLPLVRKLRGIPDFIMNDLLDKYYNAQKKKYYAVLAKWFSRKKAIEVAHPLILP